MGRTNLSKPHNPSASPVSLVNPDIEKLVIARLTDDLLSEIDIKTLPTKVFNNLVSRVKSRFFEFLASGNVSPLALNEIEAQSVDIEIDSKIA